MLGESELLAFRRRLVVALTWANKPGSGFSRHSLRELAQLRVVLDWLLESDTKAPRDWAAGIFRQLSNLESLQRSYER